MGHISYLWQLQFLGLLFLFKICKNFSVRCSEGKRSTAKPSAEGSNPVQLEDGATKLARVLCKCALWALWVLALAVDSFYCLYYIVFITGCKINIISIVVKIFR